MSFFWMGDNKTRECRMSVEDQDICWKIIVIPTNGEDPYSDQSRASNTANITWPKPLSVTRLPAVTEYTSRGALLQHFADKISNETNIYGGTTPQNFESQNIEIQKLLDLPFWCSVFGSGALTPLSILSCGLRPNYIRRFDYLSSFLLHGNA